MSRRDMYFEEDAGDKMKTKIKLMALVAGLLATGFLISFSLCLEVV